MPETQRDLVASVENRFGPSGGSTLVSKYAYGNDGLARRTYALRSGLAFAATHQDAWGYNDRNELTASRRYNDPNAGGTSNPDPNMDRTYLYDAIGNRTLSRRGTDPNSTYARNSVNQYETITTALSPIPGVQELHYDPDGNLTEALTLGDVDGDGDVDQDDIDAVLFAYGTCEGDESYNPRANFDPTGLCDGDPNFQTINQDDVDVVLFYFGLPSTGSIRARMTWDGENRLASWEALVPTAGSKKLKFKYDYMGRRVEKAVFEWDQNLGDGGDWPGSPNSVRRYVWRDWLLLLELDGPGNVLKKYTRGRDLSGLTGGMGVSPVDGAGGIGGLLSVQDANGTPSDPNDDFKYVYFYDANGNVVQVVDLAVGDPNNTIKAQYEYDAYGNVTYSAGSYATANVIRFSTKPWDDETGMGDWGVRYYDPRLGRWVNHDPIGEIGGNNLCAYVYNRPATTTDSLGDQVGFPETGPYLGPDRPTPEQACIRCLIGVAIRQKLTGEGPQKTADRLVADWLRRTGTADGKGCKTDAMQHCVGLAILAKSCGSECAIKAGEDKEEQDRMPGFPVSSRDLRNNRMGAQQCAHAFSIVTCCEMLLESNDLICEPDDSDPGFGDKDTCH